VFAREIFGLDFSFWEERGLWDESYVPYSLFDEKKVVANICVYPSTITVDGQACNGLELLTVATLPNWRGRGLQRELWDVIRREVVPHHDFVFLFTESAAGFYEKLGLKRQPEFFHRLTSPVLPSPDPIESRVLNPDHPEDYRILTTLAHDRVPVSRTLGWINPNLLLFMLIGPYREWLHYLPALDAILVIEPEGETLRIHDIIARSMPDLPSIEGFLARFRARQIDLLFSPDQLGPVETEDLPVTEDVLITDPGFRMPGPTLFPYSIRA
jgi:GNAT superfamily N-acetyltransferase